MISEAAFSASTHPLFQLLQTVAPTNDDSDPNSLTRRQPQRSKGELSATASETRFCSERGLSLIKCSHETLTGSLDSMAFTFQYSSCLYSGEKTTEPGAIAFQPP